MKRWPASRGAETVTPADEAGRGGEGPGRVVALGLDPGTRYFGWGVVAREGTRIVHLGHGVVELDDEQGLAVRLVALERALVEVVAAHRPTLASVETLFFAKDAQAASKLGHARGVALLVCARAGLLVHEYAPTLVKRAVTGSGRAEKAQVAQMMRVLLKLGPLPRLDATDALAVAVTHLQQAPALEAMAAAAARMPGGSVAPGGGGRRASASTSAAAFRKRAP